jgi:ribosomal protein S27AE
VRCPNCGSSNVKSNHANTHSLDHGAAHLGHHAARDPATAVLAGGLWLAARAIKKFTPKWKCGACSHTFN